MESQYGLEHSNKWMHNEANEANEGYTYIDATTSPRVNPCCSLSCNCCDRFHRIGSISPHPNRDPNIGITNSTIKPDDYVHHGQGDELLRHGREQGERQSNKQPEKRRDDPISLLCSIQFGPTGLTTCQPCAIMYASFATKRIYEHERIYM